MDWLDLFVVQGRDYYKELYANKMGSLEEMSKFLKRYNLLKLNREKIETMNRLITDNEIEIFLLKIFHQTKVQDKMASQTNFIKQLENS